MSQAGLPVTKPISVWNKPLEADWKALFKALTKGGKEVALLRWEELPGTGVELLSSIGVQTSHGERAYLLIRRALTATIHELVGESIPPFERLKDDVGSVVEDFDWSLEESDLQIDRRFFDRPTQLGLLDPLQSRLSDLLVALGLEPARARVASNRLGTYFTFHLAQEWRNHQSVYAPLKEALEGPFANVAEREQGWMLYDRWLQKRTEESVFGESFSIKDVYIPLRAYWEKPAQQKGEFSESGEVDADTAVRARPDSQEPRRVAVNLHDEIESWLDQPKARKAIRLLSGGPGSGKSTFARMLSAKISRGADRKVLYVPLHQLNVLADLVSSIGRFVEEDRFLTGNPLDSKNGEDRIFLILDGLDELEMQGKVGAEVASDFLDEVRRTVERRNMQEADVRVLITGRPVATDPQQTQFRQPGQLLHALPYYVPEEDRKRYDNGEILEEDQRHSWWRRYQECIGQESEGLPEKLDRDDLAEVTRQPLLNYLLALSYRRGKIDFSRETSLNQIYEDLLNAVYERQWESGRIGAVAGLELQDFHRVLEEIAVAAWHGNGRTTSMRDIRDRFTLPRLDNILKEFAGGAEAGVNRLLLAFYFRRAGRTETGDATFEFTHKSFGEYLVARRLVGMIRTLCRRLEEPAEDFDAGWDAPRALEKWAELTGPTGLEDNLLAFLRREVALRDREGVLSWQKHLAHLLSTELKSGLPMERVKPAMSYQQMTRWARNAEETLLASLNACARTTEEVSEVDWPQPTSLGDLLCRVRGQRSGSGSFALSYLSHLDASSSVLEFADLFLADLSFCHLDRCRIMCANLGNADLSNAKLHGAFLWRTDLREAHLWGADLKKGVLVEADLTRAFLAGADLREADLRWADLRQADLREADLRRAVLREADLREADLREADLREADLRELIYDPEALAEQLFQAKLLPQQLEALDLSPSQQEQVRKAVRIMENLEE